MYFLETSLQTTDETSITMSLHSVLLKHLLGTAFVITIARQKSALNNK